MSDVHAIIARCTRDGVTAWQHVAAQLGCSVDQARSRYDRQYLPVRPWPHPCEEIPPAPEVELEPIDESDMHSLAPKGPGLRMEIVETLKRHGALSPQTIASLLRRSEESIRARLSRMRHDGWVENDSGGRGNGGVGCSWAWRLTPKGIAAAVTGCAQNGSEAA